MSVIRVNPESVRQYAAAATERFAHSRTELEGLVREAVEVRYYGPNAVEFKTRCGQMTAEYSTKASAVDAVTTFTNQAQTKATEAETAINAFIDSQISSVLAADR